MYPIQYLAEEMKPRERLKAQGVSQLSSQDLLAILLRTGNKKETVYEMAARILGQYPSLATLSSLSLEELEAIPGIGPVKAMELQATMELGRRILKADLEKGDQVTGSKYLAQNLMLDFGDKQQEHLVALYLDSQNRILAQQTIFIGSLNRSLAEPREILHYAVKHMAASIIIAHNHPSGNVSPSRQDDQTTKNLKKAAQLLGIELLDHLIVSRNDYYSYREETDLL